MRKNGSKNSKNFFINVNKNKLYFPMHGLDQQDVKIIPPYCNVYSASG